MSEQASELTREWVEQTLFNIGISEGVSFYSDKPNLAALCEHYLSTTKESGAVAWMVELQGQIMPLWYSGQERPGVPVSTICAFTPDPLGGIRYPTKEAAGYALTRLRWSGGRSLENAILAVTEHEWGTYTHPAPPAPSTTPLCTALLERAADLRRRSKVSEGKTLDAGLALSLIAHELESLAAQQGDGK